jgi:hypothetical protein
MKVNNYPLKTPSAGDKLFGSDSNGDQKQFDMSNFSSTTYKVYTALLTQSGISDPTAVVLDNTLSGSIVWTRLGMGNYKATLVGEFPDADKVLILVNQAGTFPLGGGDSVYTYAYVNDADSIILDTLLSSNYQDAMLYKTSFEIRVYN